MCVCLFQCVPKLQLPNIGATTYITVAVPYWLATGGRPLCYALQKPHNIRGGSSRTETQTRCASPDSHKMRARRMGACMCVCLNVCNRGRGVKGEGCAEKGRRVKWKEKAISPLSQLMQTPFFCSVEGDTFYFPHLPLFLLPSLSYSSLSPFLSCSPSNLSSLSVAAMAPVRWRDGEIEGEVRWWGVADGGAWWGRFGDLNGLYLLTYSFSSDWQSFSWRI